MGGSGGECGAHDEVAGLGGRVDDGVHDAVVGGVSDVRRDFVICFMAARHETDAAIALVDVLQDVDAVGQAVADLAVVVLVCAAAFFELRQKTQRERLHLQ